jgi:hypothetical protein
MKKRILTMLIAALMVLTIPGFVFAQSDTPIQDQQQIQQRDRDQTNINPLDQEQARLQLRDRLHVTEGAILLRQERMRQQEQSRLLFPDMEQHWAREQVQSASQWGLVQGYPDGRFGPNGSITGPEGVAMMTRLMNCLEGIDAGTITPGAIDWEGMPEWAKAQLQERNALRIMTQTSYYDEAQLNRHQFALMLARALGIQGTDVPAGTVVFLDQDAIPAEDLGTIHALRTMGVIMGNNGNFYPEQKVTRAEAAAMLVRIADILD